MMTMWRVVCCFAVALLGFTGGFKCPTCRNDICDSELVEDLTCTIRSPPTTFLLSDQILWTSDDSDFGCLDLVYEKGRTLKLKQCAHYKSGVDPCATLRTQLDVKNCTFKVMLEVSKPTTEEPHVTESTEEPTSRTTTTTTTTVETETASTRGTSTPEVTITEPTSPDTETSSLGSTLTGSSSSSTASIPPNPSSGASGKPIDNESGHAPGVPGKPGKDPTGPGCGTVQKMSMCLLLIALSILVIPYMVSKLF